MTTDIAAALAWLQQLHEGAHAGRWHTETCKEGESCWCRLVLAASGDVVIPYASTSHRDAALIAVTRNVLPELLAVVEAAQDLNNALQDQYLGADAWMSPKGAQQFLDDALTALAAAVAREKGDK